LVESIFGEWGFKFAKIKGLAPIGGPIRGKKWKNLVNFKKSSSHELAVQIL